MSGDPFERFERSRSGFLVPLALFALGAIPTTAALVSVHRMAIRLELAERERARGEKASRDTGDTDDATGPPAAAPSPADPPASADTQESPSP